MEECRRELVKLSAGYIEEGKVALRNLRREGIERIKKQEKAGDLSEDQSHDAQGDVQKLTDRFIQRLNAMQKDKEKDILSV